MTTQQIPTTPEPPALEGARWRCVVIHGGQAERRAQMEAHLRTLNLEHKTDFRPWVSAKELQQDPKSARRLARGVRWHYHPNFSWTELGCFLAHRNRWQELVADPAHDWYVVLEDDAEPTPALAAVVENLISNRDGDLVRLHCTLRQPGVFHTLRQIVPGHALLLPLGPPAQRGKVSWIRAFDSLQLGAVAYLISKRGAARLLEANATVSRSLDCELVRFWKTDMPPLSVWPPLSDDNHLKSTQQRGHAGAVFPRSPTRLFFKMAEAASRRVERKRMKVGLSALAATFGAPDFTLAPKITGEAMAGWGSDWRCVVLHDAQTGCSAQTLNSLAACGLESKTDFRPWGSVAELEPNPRALRKLRRAVRAGARGGDPARDLQRLLTHRDLWKSLLEDAETDWYVILEDGMEATPTFVSVVESLIRGRDNDAMQLCGTLHARAAFRTIREAAPGYRLLLALGPAQPRGASTTELLGSLPQGASAYLVSKHGADRLLRYSRHSPRPAEGELARLRHLRMPVVAVQPSPLAGEALAFGESDRIGASPRTAFNPLARARAAAVRRSDAARTARVVEDLQYHRVEPDCTLEPGSL